MAGARTIRRRMENALKGATGSDVIELTEYLLSNVPSPHFERLLARAIKRHQLKEVEEKLNGGLEIVSVDDNEDKQARELQGGSGTAGAVVDR